MLLLVDAHGYEVGIVDEDVSRHEHRIGKQARVDILLSLIHIWLIMDDVITTQNPSTMLKMHEDAVVVIDRELADAVGYSCLLYTSRCV